MLVEKSVFLNFLPILFFKNKNKLSYLSLYFGLKLVKVSKSVPNASIVIIACSISLDLITNSLGCCKQAYKQANFNAL